MRVGIIAVVLAIASGVGHCQAVESMNYGQAAGPNVMCGAGYNEADCRAVTGVLRLGLSQLRIAIPGWRWVVVPESKWGPVAASFGTKPSVPAFSNLAARTTYVEGNLLSQSPMVDERLQPYSPRLGRSRLRWVLAHESGHILCNTNDERKAQDAAGRLEFGDGEVCR